MACISEALGLALTNSAMTPATYEERDNYGFESGKSCNESYRKKY